MRSIQTRSEKEVIGECKRLINQKSILYYFKTADFERIADIILITKTHSILLLEIKESTAIEFIGLMTKTLKKEKQLECNEKYYNGSSLKHLYIICLYQIPRFYVINRIKPLAERSGWMIPPKDIALYSDYISDTLSDAINWIIGCYP